MGTKCAPLVVDLFLFFNDGDFMIFLFDDKEAVVIDAVNSTSRYFDDNSSINNVYFDNMAGLENITRPLVFTSASGCRASEKFDISGEN